MTVWSDYAGYVRFGVSMLAILTYVFHAPPLHWLMDSIFSGLHVAMTAVRAVLAVFLIMKSLFATSANPFASLGSGKAVLLAAVVPLKPRLGLRMPKRTESLGRTMPLGLALLAGVGSLGAANLEAGAGLAHFAVAIASIPVICAAVWAISQLAEKRAN